MQTPSGEERVVQLLERANQLAEQAIALQQQAVARQAELFGKLDAHLQQAREINDKAAKVNEQSMGVSRMARKIQLTMVPILALLIGYVSYLLFFRI